jgi:hypothetical protein
MFSRPNGHSFNQLITKSAILPGVTSVWLKSGTTELTSRRRKPTCRSAKDHMSVLGFKTEFPSSTIVDLHFIGRTTEIEQLAD